MLISLPSMPFRAHHGVLPAEREIGGDFLVSLRLHLSDRRAHRALWEDDLSATANYATAYELVREEMAKPSQLIEHVAARIARALLRGLPAVSRAEVEVKKLCPPIAGYHGAGASVSFALDRRLVIWDFDGTLANTRAGIVRTMQATFSRLALPVPTEEAIAQTIGLPLSESIARLRENMSEEEVARAVSIYQELFEEVGNVAVTAFPGICEALRSQHAEGFFTAIATSRGRASTEQLCTRLGLSPYIDFLVACDDVAAHKPAPDPVFALCRMAGVKPADSIVIGDTTYDIHMALAAGARALGVAWGNHSPQMLQEAGANRVVFSPKELHADTITDV